mmetsp:Transcript_7276/g.18089  ORF Transcript_7276/g.18089 Transcript_7276/m.18089 type:complete len:266 (-) Transcript_7276:158-955(-)
MLPPLIGAGGTAPSRRAKDSTVSTLPALETRNSVGGLCSMRARSRSPLIAMAVLHVSFCMSAVPKVSPFLTRLPSIGTPRGAAPSVPPKREPSPLRLSSDRPFVSRYVDEYVTWSFSRSSGMITQCTMPSPSRNPSSVVAPFGPMRRRAPGGRSGGRRSEPGATAHLAGSGLSSMLTNRAFVEKLSWRDRALSSPMDWRARISSADGGRRSVVATVRCRSAPGAIAENPRVLERTQDSRAMDRARFRERTTILVCSVDAISSSSK